MKNYDLVDPDMLVEMANLLKSKTGVEGVIYISSSQGSHGPRVKWFVTLPKSKRDPCLSVTIKPNPQVKNLNLPKAVVIANQKYVRDWVRLNYEQLLNFWNDGYSWDSDKVYNFINTSLKKI